MSLLDDAKRLAEGGFSPFEISPNSGCNMCGALPGDWPYEGPFPHDPDCPWLSLPRIVAALEAAQRVVGDDPIIEQYAQGYFAACWVCNGTASTEYDTSHTPDCSWQALKTALEGDA